MLAQVHACVCMRIQYMHTPHMHKRSCTHADTHASTHRHLWQPHARMHIHANARKHTHAHTRAGRPRTRAQVPGSHARTRVCALPDDLNGHAQPRLQAPNALQQRRCGARQTSVHGMAMWVAVRIDSYACRLAYMQMMHTSVRTCRRT